MAIACQVLATTLHYLRVAVTHSRAAGHDFTHQDAQLSTFLRQAARVEREIPVNKRLCGLAVAAGSASSRLSRFSSDLPVSLFLILISLISTTGKKWCRKLPSALQAIIVLPFQHRCWRAEIWISEVAASLKPDAQLWTGIDWKRRGGRRRRGGERRLQTETRESTSFLYVVVIRQGHCFINGKWSGVHHYAWRIFSKLYVLGSDDTHKISWNEFNSLIWEKIAALAAAIITMTCSCLMCFR